MNSVLNHKPKNVHVEQPAPAPSGEGTRCCKISCCK